jgi:hypothetical protein
MTNRKAKPAVPTSLNDPAVKAVRETLHISWELSGMDIDTCCERYKEIMHTCKTLGYSDELSAALVYWDDQRKNARAYQARCRGLLAGISQLRPDGSFPLVGWQRAAKEAKRING